MTGAGVDVLTPWTVESLWTDAVRHAAAPGSRPTNAGIEARSRRAPGTQPSLTDGAAVPGWTETLECTIASVQAQSTVTTWSTVARVVSIFASVSRESGITETLSESLPTQKASPCIQKTTHTAYCYNSSGHLGKLCTYCFIFLPRDASQSAVIPQYVVCASVCLSDHLWR